MRARDVARILGVAVVMTAALSCAFIDMALAVIAVCTRLPGEFSARGS
ncbi:MAG: hypothetical protein ACRDRT_04955 [Pseudonocardiaceae bacterium]